jgi:ESS family glutamate:Na+ symporter
MLKLDFIQTVAVGGVVLFIGYALRRLFRPLAHYNIPAPVVGGLLVAVIALIFRQAGLEPVTFDLTLRDPLMIAFFTTIGFGASLSLLKVGGPQVILFFLIATVIAVGQNVLGCLLSLPFGIPPLFGVLSGSVTLTGGPATGLAFAPLFEQAGIEGAATIAVAAAMFGIVSGGLIGGPIGTVLIERHKLKKSHPGKRLVEPRTAENVVEEKMAEPKTAVPEDEDVEAYNLLKSLIAILVAMGIGSWLSKGFAALGITLPAYIGAMFTAAIIRNLDDLTRFLKLSQRTIDDIGHVALSLFLVIALMTLKLWQLAGLVVPLVVILIAQVALITLTCFWPVFKWMGRDYDAAVMSGGYCGFMLGTTANSMAIMKSLVDRYGRAPRAFLVVPMVGAFFIDFTNAIIITVFINFLK